MMDRLSWVEIDGVKYSWDGNQIDCYGQFGYHSTLAGHRLERLEIESSTGEPAGTLDVDFATGSLAFLPALGSELTTQSILVGSDLGESEIPLVNLADPKWSDLLSQSDELLIWEPQAEVSAVAPHSSQFLSWEAFGLIEGTDDLMGANPVLASSNGMDDVILLGELDNGYISLDIPPPYHDV